MCIDMNMTDPIHKVEFEICYNIYVVFFYFTCAFMSLVESVSLRRYNSRPDLKLLLTKLTAIYYIESLPNQELSWAKSELQGETVGVRSFYKRGGQPPYNLPARPPSVYTTKPASVLICTF